MSLLRQCLKYMSVVLVVVLTACASRPQTFTTQVSAFNDWSPNTKGKLYAFSQDSSHNLEQKSYEAMIAREMWRTGLMRTDNIKKAHYLVDFSIKIDEKERVVQEYYREPVFYPNFGWYFGDFGYYGWGNSFMSGFNLAYIPRVESYPVTYRRYLLTLNILDKSDKPMYQAQAVAESSQATLAQIMPYLVVSIFDDFPGMNTGPKQVVFDVDKSQEFQQPIKFDMDN